MNSEGDYGLSLALPGTQRAAAEQGVEAQRQVTDAYNLLETLGGGAGRLGQRLHREGQLALASPVALVAAVTHQQVESARRQAWLPRRSRGVHGGDPLPEWENGSPVEAADALCREIRSIALILGRAVESVPESWGTTLYHCAGSLFMVTAQLREVLQSPTNPLGYGEAVH